MIVLIIVVVVVGVAICWGWEKLNKSMEPDPEWDMKTRDRFDKKNGWIVLLSAILIMFILAKCDGGNVGRDPDESPYDEPLFK